MKAITLHSFGGPETLRYEDVPKPEPGPGEALVRVRVAGVMNIDLRTRRGGSGQPDKLPMVLGREAVGEVAHVPDGQGPGKGQRVYVYHWRFCGVCEYCMAGDENRCVSDPLKKGREDIGLMGSNASGSYAEYTVAPVRCLLPIPDGLTFEQACTLATSGGTAWHMLFERGRLRAGETALILAAGSGIAGIAIQLAKLAGATVIATTGTPEKMEKAKGLGADYVVNYAQQKVSKEVMRITRGRGVDLVFETTGAATFPESMASLAIGGRIVVGGKHTGAKVTFDLQHSMPRDWQIIDSISFTRRDVQKVYQLALGKKIKPIIHARLPLQEARKAHEILERREQFGKVLLIP